MYQRIVRPTCLVLLLASSQALIADDVYDARLSAQYSELGYDPGDGNLVAVSGTYFFKGLERDSRYPYSSAEHYQRLSSVSADYLRSDSEDLNQIIGGRLLNEIESEDRVLAGQWVPTGSGYWLAIALRFPSDTTYKFSDGSTAELENDDFAIYELGTYLTDYTTSAFRYSGEKDGGWGLNVRHLFALDSAQFIELFADISSTQDDRETFPSSKAWLLGLSYSPSLNLSIAYQYSRNDLGASNKLTSQNIFIEYWPEEGLSLNLGYDKFSASGRDVSFLIDDALSLGLSYYF